LSAIETSTDPYIILIGKYFQIVSQLGIFIIPTILFAFLDGRNIGKYLKLNAKPAFITMLFASIAIIAASPLINFIGEINQQMKLPEFMSGIEQWIRDSEDKAKILTDNFLNVTTSGGLILNLVMIAVLPAIGEEFLFRGVLQKLFNRWTKNIHLAVILAAFVFSAIHFQFYGFLPRFLMGIMLGYIFVWSGTLWAPILVHFVNNASAVIISYLSNIKIIDNSIETIGTGESASSPVLISLFLTAILLYLIYYFEKKRKER